MTQTTLGEGSASTSASSESTSPDLGIQVVADDRVAGAAQPLAHVAAHLAESDEPDLHASCLSSVVLPV